MSILDGSKASLVAVEGLAAGLSGLAEDIGEAGMRQVVALFLQTAGGARAELRQAWQMTDRRVLERRAHSLKSSLATLGATDIVERCSWVERHARDNVPASVMDELDCDMAGLCLALGSLVAP